MVHGDFREMHLFLTMKKFCRQTADKWSTGVCTVQGKADPSSVSPAMGILLFRLQLETRNKSVHRKEAVQGKAASPSSLGSAHLTQRCQSKCHSSAQIRNQACQGEGERQRFQLPRVCQAQRIGSGGNLSFGWTGRSWAG